MTTLQVRQYAQQWPKPLKPANKAFFTRLQRLEAHIPNKDPSLQLLLQSLIVDVHLTQDSLMLIRCAHILHGVQGDTRRAPKFEWPAKPL